MNSLALQSNSFANVSLANEQKELERQRKEMEVAARIKQGDLKDEVQEVRSELLDQIVK